MGAYTVVFDNNCGICTVGAKTFRKTGLIDAENTIELTDFQTNDLACNVDPERACDEMAAINNETKEVYYGLDAYSMMLKAKFPAAKFLGKMGFFKKLLNPFYRFIANNRRVIAPLTHTEKTCKPTLNKLHRFILILLLGLFAAYITFKKGEVLKGTDLFGFLNGWRLIVVTGIGWIVTGFMYQKSDKWDYWGNLAVIAGTAIFIQAIALIGYKMEPNIAWILGSMGGTDLLMTWMHYKRMKKLGNSQKYTLIWWLNLHITAVATMLFFNFYY